MQNKNDEIFAWEQVIKLFSNDYSIDNNSVISNKVIEIEEYILSIDFKKLDFKELIMYYDILNRILSKNNTKNISRELLQMTNELKTKEL